MPAADNRSTLPPRRATGLPSSKRRGLRTALPFQPAAAQALGVHKVERARRLQLGREAEEVAERGVHAWRLRGGGGGQETQVAAERERYVEGGGGERKRRDREVVGRERCLRAAACAEMHQLPKAQCAAPLQVEARVILTEAKRAPAWRDASKVIAQLAALPQLAQHGLVHFRIK